MAGTTGLTGLLSVADTSTTAVDQTGFDLHHLIGTSTDPFSCTINGGGESFPSPAFESTNPVAIDKIAGLSFWTATFSGRYPRNAPVAGHEGFVTYANGTVDGCTGWSMTLNAGTYPNTAQASTPPVWMGYLPGEYSGSGSFDGNIDDTTAVTLVTSGAATFRMNPATTVANTLACGILITGASPSVARGAKNKMAYTFDIDGNVTSAGDESLFNAGPLVTPDITEIVLRAAGSRTFTGLAFLTSLTISANIGSPIEVSGTLQGTGALTVA